MFHSDKLSYLEQLDRVERAMRSWDSTMSTSTQTFSALVNVSARREADSAAPSRVVDDAASARDAADDSAAERALTQRDRAHGRVLENAAKLESYSNGLRRVLDVLRTLVDEMAAASDAATLLYAKTVRTQLKAAASAEDGAEEARKRIRSEAVHRGSREASVLDVVEALQATAAAYEREYWVKWRIIERALDYSRPQDMDGLLQAWAEDTRIAREELRGALRRAKGVSARLSID